MGSGGARPGAGRKVGGPKGKGPSGGLGAKFAKKILMGKRPGSTKRRIEEYALELVDNPSPTSKDQEVKARFMLRLMEFAFGRPREAEHVAEAKHKTTLLLPRKKDLKDWMADKGQLQVEETKPQNRPN